MLASEQKAIVADKYNNLLQLLKKINADLFVHPSTFCSTSGRTQLRPC